MNTTLPTYDQIVALHKKHAPHEAAYDLVFTHCMIVRETAEQLMDKIDFTGDKELVKAGCLLHDVGVYRMYLPSGNVDHKNYIQHGTRGYDLLKNEGFSEKICRLASHHTGVGLSKDEIISENLPIPPNDYMAETPEERLLMYADKFHSKSTPPRFLSPQTYCKQLERFTAGNEKVARFKKFEKEFGTPDLQPLAKKYGMEII